MYSQLIVEGNNGISKYQPASQLALGKIALGGIVLTGLAVGTYAYAQQKPLPTVDKVELDRYLGVWYEVARKPAFPKMCLQRICNLHFK